MHQQRETLRPNTVSSITRPSALCVSFALKALHPITGTKPFSWASHDFELSPDWRTPQDWLHCQGGRTSILSVWYDSGRDGMARSSLPALASQHTSHTKPPFWRREIALNCFLARRNRAKDTMG
ncbi:hypothetical protein Bbelb_104530 [Branchiostoma belcheri]|nr:hypothetical protein Bbelb_104530 [Branchiostoma belcheri]